MQHQLDSEDFFYWFRDITNWRIQRIWILIIPLDFNARGLCSLVSAAGEYELRFAKTRPRTEGCMVHDKDGSGRD